MKRTIAIFVFGICQILFSQEEHEFGKLTTTEKSFTQYERDTTANAIYLYEKGANFFEVRYNKIRLITKYHAKIKILRKEGFEHATVEIPYYRNASTGEKSLKIWAFTHNNEEKIPVDEDQIFDEEISARGSIRKFTFPKVEVGSILEYSYEIESPFFFNLTGWKFQSNIPKIYTEYYAEIPGNWVYNRSLIGNLKLDINESNVKKGCFRVPIARRPSDCETLRYAMKDVPAFKESEDYMLSGNNYRSKLEFELSEYIDFTGSKTKYTKSWEDVDKEFKDDKDVGHQLRKKNFFERKVPNELLKGSDPLEKAKNIYKFVQNHFTWNGGYGLWHHNNVKKAFDEQRGNVAEINMVLINLLNAAGIETNMMLSSTRKNGLPKLGHPVMGDFNYIMAIARINDQDYLLDATDKMQPFGMIPFRCLNHYGRVMDFERKSYWYNIAPEQGNRRSIRATMSFDKAEGIAFGKFDLFSEGYESVRQRKKIDKKDREEYLREIEGGFGDDLYIKSYSVEKELSGETKMMEQFEFEMENILRDNAIYMNPFLTKFFKKNPFVSDERSYPIDFGYPRSYEYRLSMAIPDGYKIKNLPEKTNLKLPQDSGYLRFESNESFGKVNVFFKLGINAVQFKSEAYHIIKAFFTEAVDIQNKSFIVLEKA
ncbi:DUF3857 domain-containing protein [Flagellimonas sp. 2504JD4-2]